MRSIEKAALEKVVLTGSGGARCEVYLYGAHATSWVPSGGSERLFLSERSEFRPGVAIRGGIPVVFPQFAGLGPLPKHGFARTSLWELRETPTNRARLRLCDSATTRAVWPHAFQAEVEFGVDDLTLRVALTVENTGEAEFAFTAALHTYLAVADVAKTTVDGLRGLAFRDNRSGAQSDRDLGSALRLGEEVDRVYSGLPSRLTVLEPARTTQVRAEGFPDAVVWNPGAQAAARLADLEPEGWRHFICVEAATIRSPVVLAPGEGWHGAQLLQAM